MNAQIEPGAMQAVADILDALPVPVQGMGVDQDPANADAVKVEFFRLDDSDILAPAQLQEQIKSIESDHARDVNLAVQQREPPNGQAFIGITGTVVVATEDGGD